MGIFSNRYELFMTNENGLFAFSAICEMKGNIEGWKRVIGINFNPSSMDNFIHSQNEQDHRKKIPSKVSICGSRIIIKKLFNDKNKIIFIE